VTYLGKKKVAWSKPIPIGRVKELALGLEGTMNDVLLTCAAGAVRHFMKSQQKIIERAPIHMAVPFNLRPLDKPIEKLGNEFGMVIVALPIGLGDPLERFHAVKNHMDQLKHSLQPQVFFGLLDLLGKGPSVLEKSALELLSQKASAVMTNVPGPKKAVYLAGSKLKQPMFWVPQSGEVGIGLSILSYDGHIQFGIVADKNLITSPDDLATYFEHSLIELATHHHRSIIN
jgi:WS/DGAT/MGAT family acyltransferase